MVRQHALCLRALLAAGVLSLALPASAQYRAPEPVPEPAPPAPPPVDPSGPPPEAALLDAAPAAPLGTGWDTQLVLDGVWEENVGFQSPPGPGDFYGGLRASVGRWRRSTRGEVRITADGAGYLYRELSELNRADGAATINATTRFSSRVEGALSGTFSYGHTDTEDLIINEGLVLPPVRTQTGGAGGGISWWVAERTTLALDGSWQRVWFDSDELLETQSARASLALSHRLGSRDMVSVEAAFLRTEDDLSVRRDPTLVLGYQRNLTRGLTLGINAGSSRNEVLETDDPEPVVPQWNFTGGASLQGWVRRTSLTLRYEHGLRPAPGLGVTELTDLVNFAATVPVGRSLQLLLSGAAALRGEPGAPRSRDSDVFAGLAARLARPLRLVVGYRFRVRDGRDATEAVRNDRASASLVWGSQASLSNR